MALTTPFFRVKMQQINHYTIAKKGLHSLCLHGFSSIFHARFHRKNERNPVHSFYGLVHSFLRRCWFISQDLRLFRKIFAFFASYSAIIFDGLALGWYVPTGRTSICLSVLLAPAVQHLLVIFEIR